MKTRTWACKGCEVSGEMGAIGRIKEWCPSCIKTRRRQDRQRWEQANPEQAKACKKAWQDKQPKKPARTFTCKDCSRDGEALRSGPLPTRCPPCAQTWAYVQNAAWFVTHPEATLLTKQRYREANREKENERARLSRSLNPEPRRLANAKWKAQNRETVRGFYRKHGGLRRARLKGLLTFPFTDAQLTQRLSMQSGCWMCGEEGTQVDHVKPVARKGAHILANFRPACRSCNSAKRDKWLSSGVTLKEFLRLMGRPLPVRRPLP
jgi:5-methylcytosine-specific restriction endonuclease McrA